MKIQSLVVPTDFSETAGAALGWAVSLARLDGASLHLVHALKFPVLAAPYEVSVPPAVLDGMHRAASERIEALRKEAEDSGISEVTAEIAESSAPVHAIEQAVQTHAADLVVMGTHGYGGIKHAWLGSVAERSIRTLTCPVLAAKGAMVGETPAIRRILVPVDFSAHSDEAASVAKGLAARFDASIHLLHAIDLAPEYAVHPTNEAMELEREIKAIATERLEQVAQSISDAKVPVEVQLERGAPAAVIASKAEQLGSDLIVMGTHGHTGLTHLFIGSVTERTLRTAPGSVLAVKANDTEVVP